MKCLHCGSSARPGDLICRSCGATFATKPKESAALKKILADRAGAEKRQGSADESLPETVADLPNTSSQESEAENQDSKSVAPEQGNIIANRFKVLGVVGMNDFGAVYAAQDIFDGATCWSCQAEWRVGEDQFCPDCGAQRFGKEIWLHAYVADLAGEADTVIFDHTGDWLVYHTKPDFQDIGYDTNALPIISESPASNTPLSAAAQDEAASADQFTDAPTMEFTQFELTGAIQENIAAENSDSAPQQRENTPQRVWSANDMPTVETLIFEQFPESADENIQFLCSVSSDRGILRRDKPNEDSALIFSLMVGGESTAQQLTLCLVCDGLGGHDDGQRAGRYTAQSIAATVIDKIVKQSLTHPKGIQYTANQLGDTLSEAIRKANADLVHLNAKEGGDMGCTVTALLSYGSEVCAANVGDSRTYLFRDERLTQITKDHSLVARLVLAKMIRPEEIYTHPQRSKVYRSMGEIEDVEVDIFPMTAHKKDVFLLCSDGLWEMVRDPEIAETMLRFGHLGPAALAQKFVEVAKEFGGEDNVTAVVAQVI